MPRSIKNITRKYLAELREQKIPFIEAYLFGSYASGRAHRDSDIDVAIITEKRFTPRALLNENMRLREFSINIDPRIEPILMEAREFQRGNESILAREIKENGIRIH